MISKFLSRYTSLYPRTIVYMLQASEYSIKEYVKWYYVTSDFNEVSRRKELDLTPKARVLLVCAWLILLLFVVAGVFAAFNVGGLTGLVLAIFIAGLGPLLLGELILAPLMVFTFLLQRPVELIITRKARNILQKHSGFKIAIAGSYGKTSMREILRATLSEGKRVAAPPHSHNTPIGISRFAEKLKGDEEVLIFEFGEYYPGDVETLAELVDPDLGVITGVNESHLKKFKTLETTTTTIFELADYLGDEPVYVNADDERAKARAEDAHLCYSKKGIGDKNVSDVRVSEDGSAFTYGGTKYTTKLLGAHQVGPLVAGIDIARRLGLSDAEIQAGVANTKPFEHRLEPKEQSDGVLYLDDSYNGNPDGVTAVIDFLKIFESRRRWYVTPGLVEMGPRTEEVHRTIGKQLAEAQIEKVLLIHNSVTPHIEAGLKEANFKGDIVWHNDALEAFNALPLLTTKGDVVLLQNDWPDQYR